MAEQEGTRLLEAGPAGALTVDVGIKRTRSRIWEGLKVLVYIALYLSVGPTLILVNRSLLKKHNFNYPMMLSGLGLLFSSAVSTSLVASGVVKLEHSALITRQFFLRNLLPIGAAMAATLAAGNAVYLYLPVGFIQMLKAFTPVVTLIMLVVLAIEIPTTRVSLSVLGICVGTAIASLGAGELNFLGVAVMLTAEVAEAVRLVLTQKLLQNLKFGVIEGQYYMAPVSALWLFTASAFLELPRAFRSNAWTVVQDQYQLFILSALLGFFVNICTFLVIKATNSVTLKVLGTARNAGLVVFSTLLLGESVTRMELAGYSVSLAAFAFYNYFKIYRL